jgi:peroxiredoxin
MIKRFHFLIAFLFLAILHTATAQVVTIKGKADKSYYNKLLFAVVYTDYLTNNYQELAHTIIDSTGVFELSFKNTTTNLVLLQVDNLQASLYIEPAKKYRVALLPKQPGAIETLSQRTPVELTFLNADSLELNYLIADYTERYDRFLEKRISYAMNEGKQLERQVDSFEVRTKRKYAKIKNSYFQEHIIYNMASMKFPFKKNEVLFKNYIENKPLHYANAEYMNFINTFLTNLFEPQLETVACAKEVNDIQTYESLKNYLANVKYLTNDTLLEYAMIKLVFDCYYNENYKKDRVLGFIKKLADACTYDENKKIATAISNKLTNLTEGQPAPGFELVDRNDKPVKLESFKGFYVYLAFWNSTVAACEEEMRLIPAYKKAYGNYIKFVYISIDKDAGTMKQFLKKHPKFDWTFLHYGNKLQLLDKYEVKTLPVYYLINPEGNLLHVPALSPGDNLDTEFMTIKNKNKERVKVFHDK